MSEAAAEAATAAAEPAGQPTAASIMAAADAAQSAFLGAERPAAGAAEEGGAESAEAAETKAEDTADADASKEPPKLKRTERRPASAEEAFRARLKARQEAAQATRTAKSEPSEVSAMRQELERLRVEGKTSTEKLSKYEAALRERNVEEFVKLGGWSSVEEMTREFISGQKPPPIPKDPEVEQIKKELEELRAEKAREAAEKREAEERAQAQREYDETLGWIKEIAETHEVPSVKAIVQDETVRNVFLTQVHAVLDADPNLPMDDAFGMVLDSYQPVAKGLLRVFPEVIADFLAENPDFIKTIKTQPPKAGGLQGLKPDAAKGLPGRDRTRATEANRRGSTDEGKSASSNAEAETEAWKPELADAWGDRKQREFLRRLSTTG